jgi:hypothetical protein
MKPRFNNLKRNFNKGLKSKELVEAEKKTVVMVREIGGFPDRYRTFLTLSATAQGIGTNLAISNGYAIRFNVPYGAGGNKPLGYGPLSDVYDSYLVHGCSIKV